MQSPLPLSSVQVRGSDLNLENLHLDLQVVESTHANVAAALANITSSCNFIDRPSNLAGPSHPIRGISLPNESTGKCNDNGGVDREVQERAYFERATSSNGSRRQHYFFIVVSLCASNPWSKCALQTCVSVQPLMVRGSNPGVYKKRDEELVAQMPEDVNEASFTSLLAEALSSDMESASPARSLPSSPPHGGLPPPTGWCTRPSLGYDILHTREGYSARVGINNEDPHEALSVRGNIEMSGHLMRPSDRRIKQNLRVVNSEEQLQRIRDIQLYDYERQDLASGKWVPERGVIAQELAQILPGSVEIRGDVILPSGQTIQDFCTVNERNLMIEHLGATQALANQVERIEATQEGLLMRIIPESCTGARDWARSGNRERVASVERKLTLVCWGVVLVLLLVAGVFYFRDRELLLHEQDDDDMDSGSALTKVATELTHSILHVPGWHSADAQAVAEEY